MTLSNVELLESLCSLAKDAGRAILRDKNRKFSVSFKEDQSPLTSADLASHNTIVCGLDALKTKLPILSEESAVVPFSERSSWSAYFLVDPLDGTKEFVKGRKEYTVNIALIERGEPTLGVVYVPETEVLFAGLDGSGSFRQEGTGAREAIHVATASAPVPRVLGSSHHISSRMSAFLSELGEHDLTRFGSSLKMCRVADGTADVYPRFGPTSEWDTAAGHGVVHAAGGRVVQLDGSPLNYNQKESMLNPEFLVIGPDDHDWLRLARAALAS